MNNFKFLKEYENLQQGIMADEFYDLGFCRIMYCKTDPFPFWNHALVNKQVNHQELEKVEDMLTKLDRSPAFYYEKKPELETLTSFLKDHDYEFLAEDSWMFHNGTNIDKTRFNQVRKVSSPKDLEVFLKTFDKCYQENDPQNPYGSLGNYLKAAEEAWTDHSSTNKVEYFIAYKDTEPVAVSTLTNYKNLGYISNVGSLIKVRGEGFGKLSTMYCIYKSKKNKNTKHFLATEEGTYPNEFYKRIGFVPKFAGVVYSKKKGE